MLYVYRVLLQLLRVAMLIWLLLSLSLSLLLLLLLAAFVRRRTCTSRGILDKNSKTYCQSFLSRTKAL